jgi:hypothetical protein
MAEHRCIDRLAPELDPDVLADVEAWATHAGLRKLHLALTGHTTLKPFLDTYAEALVARHLLARGCDLRLEIETPGGKACDFEVTVGDELFYLHVKRLDTDRPGRRRLTISSRLRSLERIERPYVVSVRWREGARDRDLQRLVREAGEFIRHARVGEELVVRNREGAEVGGVLIVAPWEGTHVTLVIGLPSGFIDDAPRMQRLMQRAYRQFMPRSDNVILLCSSHGEEFDDFRAALLGAHVERWDTYPPRGRRIAHGRADDGFWCERRYVDSRAAGWFRFSRSAKSIDIRLLRRTDPAPGESLRGALDVVFPGEESAGARHAG